jgi:hypothetical protein
VRDEPRWKSFKWKQPYARGLERLRRDVLPRPDFDPAVLWQWGTMQAMALIEVLKSAEAELGEAGQKLVSEALRRTGFDVVRQMLDGAEYPPDATEAELVSWFTTLVNRIAYASVEDPKIDGGGVVSFDIVWCPHQDHYAAFDCRVQRYFVQGMLEAAAQFGMVHGWTVKFDSTIPAGAPTCHFTVWKASDEDRARWRADTQLIEARALAHRRGAGPPPAR